jgi:hypothetical protein
MLKIIKQAFRLFFPKKIRGIVGLIKLVSVYLIFFVLITVVVYNKKQLRFLTQRIQSLYLQKDLSEFDELLKIGDKNSAWAKMLALLEKNRLQPDVLRKAIGFLLSEHEGSASILMEELAGVAALSGDDYKNHAVYYGQNRMGAEFIKVMIDHGEKMPVDLELIKYLRSYWDKIPNIDRIHQIFFEQVQKKSADSQEYLAYMECLLSSSQNSFRNQGLLLAEKNLENDNDKLKMETIRILERTDSMPAEENGKILKYLEKKQSRTPEDEAVFIHFIIKLYPNRRNEMIQYLSHLLKQSESKDKGVYARLLVNQKEMTLVLTNMTENDALKSRVALEAYLTSCAYVKRYDKALFTINHPDILKIVSVRDQIMYRLHMHYVQNASVEKMGEVLRQELENASAKNNGALAFFLGIYARNRGYQQFAKEAFEIAQTYDRINKVSMTELIAGSNRQNDILEQISYTDKAVKNYPKESRYLNRWLYLKLLYGEELELIGDEFYAKLGTDGNHPYFPFLRAFLAYRMNEKEVVKKIVGELNFKQYSDGERAVFSRLADSVGRTDLAEAAIKLIRKNAVMLSEERSRFSSQ